MASYSKYTIIHFVLSSQTFTVLYLVQIVYILIKKKKNIYQINIDQDYLISEYAFSCVYHHLKKDCEDILINDS